MKKIIIAICIMIGTICVSLIGIGISTGYFLGLGTVQTSDLKEYIETNSASDSNYVYVDVRDSVKYDEGHVMGFSNIKSSEILNDELTLSKQSTIVVMSDDGTESKKVAKHLLKQGYTAVNVEGSIEDYDGMLAYK